jgi:hypothetical protein
MYKAHVFKLLWRFFKGPAFSAPGGHAPFSYHITPARALRALSAAEGRGRKPGLWAGC